jgi:glucuronate isomerase
MQLHPGSLRDHNERVFRRFGSDKGADIPVATEYTRNLRPLLDEFGNDPRLTLVIFTLDESTYARELAPLAGHYPAVRLGPPWWFHDSREGMRRFREWTTETAGIYNTAGFNDDTRAFCSIPARHDLARRMDANFLGGLVARHIVDMSDAREMARALAYDLVKETYKFDEKRPPASGKVAVRQKAGVTR